MLWGRCGHHRIKMNLKKLLIGLDQTLNSQITLSDGEGEVDEMLSARAWRLRESHPKLHKVIDKFFFWDDNHCEECYKMERERDQLPKDYHD